MWSRLFTSRSAKVIANEGDQETRGHISTCRPLNSRCSGPPICAPSICRHLSCPKSHSQSHPASVAELSVLLAAMLLPLIELAVQSATT